MLQKFGIEDNISFYSNSHKDGRGKRDFILNLVWAAEFEPPLQRHLSGVQGEHEILESDDQSTENKRMDVTIDDCFQEFKKPEILDEDNMWYCNKCKTHVKATKKIEFFKVPPIMVVSLKRFKQEKQRSSGYMSMFSGGGGGQKIDDQVDFPLEGLDMSKYIVGGAPEGESLIYDCYAISNHFGNMGFGHYTAFAQNPLDKKWYEYDDSRVKEISIQNLQQTVVTNAAYNLFFRRRDWHEANMESGVDFDKIALRPDIQMFDKH